MKINTTIIVALALVLAVGSVSSFVTLTAFAGSQFTDAQDKALKKFLSCVKGSWDDEGLARSDVINCYNIHLLSLFT
jgi:hypothetical protein